MERAEVAVDWMAGYPSIQNDGEMVALARAAAAPLLSAGLLSSLLAILLIAVALGWAADSAGTAVAGVLPMLLVAGSTVWSAVNAGAGFRVLQADGGTRTAAITGAYVALADAITYLRAAGKLSDPQPLSCAIAAVSVGVVDGRVRLDLPYEEDSRAEVDMNVVATDAGTLVEVQGTGEGATFPRATLDKLLDMAEIGTDKLFVAQREALALPYPGTLPEPA